LLHSLLAETFARFGFASPPEVKDGLRWAVSANEDTTIYFIPAPDGRLDIAAEIDELPDPEDDSYSLLEILAAAIGLGHGKAFYKSVTTECDDSRMWFHDPREDRLCGNRRRVHHALIPWYQD
jgi:hypothetical protein